MNFRFVIFVLSAAILCIACGGNSNTSSPKIKDLAFENSSSPKEYADLIIKTVRTNRDKVLFEQFSDSNDIDPKQLNLMVKTYSQAFGDKKKEWEFVDFYAANGGEPSALEGYDYTWYDERGRIAIQINVLPKGSSNGFSLEKLEFRSRIDVLDSEAFPGGPIGDYKKLTAKK